jgi:hypothetical protein
MVGSTTGTPEKNGFALVAEDGNPVSFVPHVQSEIFMAAGKTFDALINVPAVGGTALPIYDRELSLSANKINRDAGTLAYIGVNGAGFRRRRVLERHLPILIPITRSFRARRSRYRI